MPRLAGLHSWPLAAATNQYCCRCDPPTTPRPLQTVEVSGNVTFSSENSQKEREYSEVGCDSVAGSLAASCACMLANAASKATP